MSKTFRHMNMFIPLRWVLTAAASGLLLAAGGGSLQAQGVQEGVEERPVTLDEAVAQALDENRALRAADARARAAELGAGAESGFLFPSVQATAGAVRTNDPVGVFGTRLRQRRFTQADFDIGALNDPDAVSDWTAGVGARWELGRLDRWVARDAAVARSEAAAAMRDRTREATVYRTRVLFADAVQAAAARDALLAADSAAAVTVEVVANRVARGFGTEADRLQAEAARSEIQARLAGAEARALDTREALAAHLGWPGEMRALPVTDPAYDDLVRDGAASAGTLPDTLGRADLVAGRASVQAARAEARSVTARRLPGLEAFGNLSTHAATIGGSREANWTVGVQLSVPVFTGFSLSRGAEAAQANVRALELEQAQREREAVSEIRAARRGLEAARSGRDAAEAAHAAAREAARLLSRRYEEGMASVADLVQAQLRAASLSTQVSAAEANVAMAAATVDFVSAGSGGAS